MPMTSRTGAARRVIGTVRAVELLRRIGGVSPADRTWEMRALSEVPTPLGASTQIYGVIVTLCALGALALADYRIFIAGALIPIAPMVCFYLFLQKVRAARLAGEQQLANPHRAPSHAEHRFRHQPSQ